MFSHPAVAVAILVVAGENVQAGFKPVGEAMGDLYGFMQSMRGGRRSVFSPVCPRNRARPLEGEVAVQFHHRDALFHDLPRINLDLVIVLSLHRDSRRGQRETKPKRAHRSSFRSDSTFWGAHAADRKAVLR